MNEYVKNLSRLEFVITMACTGRCRHCSQGDHAGNSGHIDPDAAERAVRDVCGRFRIQSMMAFGGEPLLWPEVTCRIFRAGALYGVPHIDLITNGFFSRDPERIRAVARMLANSGANRVLLSVDAFHQESIPLEPVKLFARRVREVGIPLELSPAWLASPEDGNPYNIRTREILRSFASLDIPVGDGNVIFPSGNALSYLGDYFKDTTPPPDPYVQDPTDIRAVSFEPDGGVLGGNILRQSVLDILDSYRP